jgi:hypothetical protein
VVIPKLIPFVCVLEEQIIMYEWLEQRSLRCDLPVAMLVSHRLVGVVLYKLHSNMKMLAVTVV